MSHYDALVPAAPGFVLVEPDDSRWPVIAWAVTERNHGCFDITPVSLLGDLPSDWRVCDADERVVMTATRKR